MVSLYFVIVEWTNKLLVIRLTVRGLQPVYQILREEVLIFLNIIGSPTRKRMFLTSDYDPLHAFSLCIHTYLIKILYFAKYKLQTIRYKFSTSLYISELTSLSNMTYILNNSMKMDVVDGIHLLKASGSR